MCLWHRRSLNKTAGFADWQGVVRDVPSLRAPGFAIALSGGQMGGMFGSFPDVSAQVGFHLLQG